MAYNRMTFGEHLRQFALSIDFIETYQGVIIHEIIKKYLEKQLNAVQVALFARAVVDDREGMETVWSFPPLRVRQSLRREDGAYRRQLAMAIGDSRNLWVVSTNGERLCPENRGVDVWGDCEDAELPPFYLSRHAQPSLSSIIVMTRDSHGQINGALLVEIRDPVRPTRVLRNEMRLLADAVGILYATDLGTKEQREGTNNAISRLGDLLPNMDLDTGPRPLMFIACSHRAPEDAMAVIKETLEEYEDHVFAVHWGDIHHPGNINMQLVEQIRQAHYGICFLSEDNGDSKGRRGKTSTFCDNPNVLVEAGMLHMVTSADSSTGTGWIPIREERSPAPPFDLENQRMVIVRRDKSGKLDTEDLQNDLRNKLNTLLDTDRASSTDGSQKATITSREGLDD